MQSVSLKAEKRSEKGSRRAVRLRNEGFIPAVLYGKKRNPELLKVKVSDFREALAKGGKNSIFNIKLDDGSTYPAMIKEIQDDIIKDKILHVDFNQISLDETVRIDVPVRVTGRGEVEKMGGIIVQQMDAVMVECLPADTPQFIEADISGLGIGESLNVGQLTVPEGITLLNDPSDVILSVTEAKAQVEETEEEEGETEAAEADAE